LAVLARFADSYFTRPSLGGSSGTDVAEIMYCELWNLAVVYLDG